MSASNSNSNSGPAGTDLEGQVRFLVNCIRFSNQGKVDFDAVATECQIVSKAAAAKRFERLLKPYGIKPGDLTKPTNTASPGPSPAPKTPSKSASKATPKNKSAGKRAAAGAAASPTTNTKRAKLASHPAVASYKDEDDAEEDEQFHVKKEEDKSNDDSSADAAEGDEQFQV